MDGSGDILGWLERSYLFEGMSPAELAPLAAACRARTYGRGECVFHIGDEADELFVVASGEVKDRVIDQDGQEVIHFTHGPGMTFGEPGFFSVERERIVEVIATEPTTLVRVHRRHLVPFMQVHEVVKDRALEALASNTRWQTTMIAALVTRPLAERLLIRLLELVDSAANVPGAPASTPRITQSMLAAMLGVSRENVNRALAALALDGVIRQDGGRYVLVDEQRLRREVAQGLPIVGRRDRRAGPGTAPGVTQGHSETPGVPAP